MLLPDGMELRICVPYNSRSTAWASFDGRGRVELKQGDHIKITASRYPFPTVCANKQSTDWFQSVSRTLRWNEREKQKSFVVVEEDQPKRSPKHQSGTGSDSHPGSPSSESASANQRPGGVLSTASKIMGKGLQMTGIPSLVRSQSQVSSSGADKASEQGTERGGTVKEEEEEDEEEDETPLESEEEEEDFDIDE